MTRFFVAFCVTLASFALSAGFVRFQLNLEVLSLQQHYQQQKFPPNPGGEFFYRRFIERVEKGRCQKYRFLDHPEKRRKCLNFVEESLFSMLKNAFIERIITRIFQGGGARCFKAAHFLERHQNKGLACGSSKVSIFYFSMSSDSFDSGEQLLS